MKEINPIKINELARKGSRAMLQIEALMLILQTIDTENAVANLGGDRFAESVSIIGEIGEKIAGEISDAFSLIQNEVYVPQGEKYEN